MTTGARISALRESRDVLQKDLAKAIHVDPVVLNRIEKGKRSARDDELKAIADYFNVSADYLLGRDAIKAPALSDEQTTVLSGFDALTLSEIYTLFAHMSSRLYKNLKFLYNALDNTTKGGYRCEVGRNYSRIQTKQQNVNGRFCKSVWH